MFSGYKVQQTKKRHQMVSVQFKYWST